MIEREAPIRMGDENKAWVNGAMWKGPLSGRKEELEMEKRRSVPIQEEWEEKTPQNNITPISN